MFISVPVTTNCCVFVSLERALYIYIDAGPLPQRPPCFYSSTGDTGCREGLLHSYVEMTA